MDVGTQVSGSELQRVQFVMKGGKIIRNDLATSAATAAAHHPADPAATRSCGGDLEGTLTESKTLTT